MVNWSPATLVAWWEMSASLGLAVVMLVGASQSARAEEMNLPISFAGGHETDKQDGGRPVVLIAAALGVTPEVFRKAFSGVTPARDRKPSPAAARSNKAALLRVLKPHGVTNERLDEVSDYYRYQPQRGEIWKSSAAKAHAVIENGQIKKIVVTAAGAGYSSSPTATLAGMEEVELQVNLQFGKDLKTNGSVKSIEVSAPNP